MKVNPIKTGLIRALILFLSSCFFLGGCQSTYYSVWEKLGKEKRHLLKENVEKAKSEQTLATEQFESIVDRIKDLYGFDGGELESVYENLKDDYRECEIRAASVRDRIENVEKIAFDMFREWEEEIDAISNVNLKSKSKKALTKTRIRYDKLERAMSRAEASMLPVLQNLNDYVLFMKHNLNAQAVSSLGKEVGNIELEVSSLIADMKKSIKAADEFLKVMN